ncbi:MAG: hypothetical protein HAW67_00575 [Endozoicomonadaceae bacterium]|nr:hypothetical protein [Endozoicomonadaceae bacterium]
MAERSLTKVFVVVAIQKVQALSFTPIALQKNTTQQESKQFSVMVVL